MAENTHSTSGAADAGPGNASGLTNGHPNAPKPSGANTVNNPVQGIQGQITSNHPAAWMVMTHGIPNGNMMPMTPMNPMAVVAPTTPTAAMGFNFDHPNMGNIQMPMGFAAANTPHAVNHNVTSHSDQNTAHANMTNGQSNPTMANSNHPVNTANIGPAYNTINAHPRVGHHSHMGNGAYPNMAHHNMFDPGKLAYMSTLNQNALNGNLGNTGYNMGPFAVQGYPPNMRNMVAANMPQMAYFPHMGSGHNFSTQGMPQNATPAQQHPNIQGMAQPGNVPQQPHMGGFHYNGFTPGQAPQQQQVPAGYRTPSPKRPAPATPGSDPLVELLEDSSPKADKTGAKHPAPDPTESPLAKRPKFTEQQTPGTLPATAQTSNTVSTAITALPAVALPVVPHGSPTNPGGISSMNLFGDTPEAKIAKAAFDRGADAAIEWCHQVLTNIDKGEGISSKSVLGIQPSERRFSDSAPVRRQKLQASLDAWKAMWCHSLNTTPRPNRLDWFRITEKTPECFPKMTGQNNDAVKKQVIDLTEDGAAVAIPTAVSPAKPRPSPKRAANRVKAKGRASPQKSPRKTYKKSAKLNVDVQDPIDPSKSRAPSVASGVDTVTPPPSDQDTSSSQSPVGQDGAASTNTPPDMRKAKGILTQTLSDTTLAAAFNSNGKTQTNVYYNPMFPPPKKIEYPAWDVDSASPPPATAAQGGKAQDKSDDLFGEDFDMASFEDNLWEEFLHTTIGNGADAFPELTGSNTTTDTETDATVPTQTTLADPGENDAAVQNSEQNDDNPWGLALPPTPLA